MKTLSERRENALERAACLAAARSVIKIAIETNTPVIIGVNGKATEVDPRKIRLPGDKKSRHSTKKKGNVTSKRVRSR